MTARAYRYGAKAPTVNHDRVLDQMDGQRRYYNRLIEIERWRRLLHADGCATAKEDAAQAVRDARAECGIYWGSYLLAEDAAQDAARSVKHFRAKRDSKCSCGVEVKTGEWIEVATRKIVGCRNCGPALRFRRLRGLDGSIGVQLQGGLSVPDLLSSKDTRARLYRDPTPSAHHATSSRKRWLLDVRVGSDGRDPIWATVPVFLHRPLPSDARVKWITVHARMRATHAEWSVSIVLEGERLGRQLPPPSLGPIGVHVDLESGAVAWIDEDGDAETWSAPPEIAERLQRVAGLQSTRDKYFDAVREALLAMPRGKWPEWMTARQIAAMKSPHPLRRMVAHWRSNRWPSDEVQFGACEAWRKKEMHLYEYQENLRARALARRREEYRLLAVRLARHRVIAVRQIDLARVAWEGRRSDEVDNGARHAAAPHELLDCLADAARRAGCEWIEVPADTPPGEILRAALSGDHAAPRSRGKAPVLAAETAAAKRRAAGLETRRQRRSKTEVQVVDSVDLSA